MPVSMNIRMKAAGLPVWMVALFCSISCNRPSPPSNDNAIQRAGAKQVSKESIKRLNRVDGHRVYVPVYSHIYHEKNDVFNLTNTLSIRNTDASSAIYISSVKYYDTAGKLVREHAASPIMLPPLATLEYIIGVNDTVGGSGANFIVAWLSDRSVTQPVIESVMIGTRSQQGISFISMGTVLD